VGLNGAAEGTAWPSSAMRGGFRRAPPRATYHGACERMVAWGHARLVERRGRLWRRSGSHRPTGELGGGGVGGVEGVDGVGLIQLVAEHKGLGRRTRRRQGLRSGRDAEVIQYFGHHPRRRDQGQQDHLGLASGATEPGDTEASHQQAGPKAASGVGPRAGPTARRPWRRAHRQSPGQLPLRCRRSPAQRRALPGVCRSAVRAASRAGGWRCSGARWCRCHRLGRYWQ
jgi:hypothetical protein